MGSNQSTSAAMTDVLGCCKSSEPRGPQSKGNMISVRPKDISTSQHMSTPPTGNIRGFQPGHHSSTSSVVHSPATPGKPVIAKTLVAWPVSASHREASVEASMSGCMDPSGMLMTSPVSEAWDPDYGKVTVFHRDLSLTPTGQNLSTSPLNTADTTISPSGSFSTQRPRNSPAVLSPPTVFKPRTAFSRIPEENENRIANKAMYQGDYKSPPLFRTSDLPAIAPHQPKRAII